MVSSWIHVPRSRGRDHHVDARPCAGGQRRQASLYICKVSESFGETKKNLRTLLTKFWLTLLHRRHDHVTDSGIRETIQMRATAIGFDDIERLCAAVVGAVEDGTDGQTEGKPKLVTRSSCTCCRRKNERKENGTRRSETYRAWTFCWWMVLLSSLRCWMISVDCGVRVVQFIGICHWRLFGTSRVMPILAKFIFVFTMIRCTARMQQIEPGQIPRRNY
jgi:CRISPR/Cas system-associated endoribonuclease Cas2